MQESIPLSKPITLNGVQVDRLTLREPTVGDQLIARKIAAQDDVQFELNMFASLAGCSPNDLHQLPLRDYDKLQKAYLRLSDPTAVTPTSQPTMADVGTILG
ncbi:phage tail assembly protein [Chitinimonas sp. PSY-7]|uniref:phage tail assembly protein n=1 Tax=Chitinimonas sp. PSY-7 TaxID=3459088 RepID=UPI004040300C